MRILALDVGTTSIRGIVMDDAGRFVDEESRQTPLIISGSFIEQSPTVYRDCLYGICSRLSRDNEIDAVSITGFRSAPMLISSDGEPLSNFIMWQ
ncbi:MAG: FGGY family carbohydrate kinase, partial [Clostridia bacterium]|nr:FGGY family carbohydrate kinase [Clostridia bacterium]